MDEKPRLTPEHFYKFFQCPHWIWFDLYGDQAKKQAVPPLMDIIFRGKADVHGVLRRHKKFEELRPDQYKDLEEAHLATLELMKQGKNIYHGVLMTEEWVGMPDLLEARPGKSAFGDWQYVAYDVQRSLDLRDEYKFPLVLYSLILERLQGVLPREAYIIDPQGNERSFLVPDFVSQFHLTRQEIESILDGQKPAPFLKSGCKRSPWYCLCLEETQGCNDVSLVYRLTQNDQRRLYSIGIRTVGDLAKTDVEELRQKLEDWPFDKVIRFSNQARVLESNQPMIIRKSEFPQVATEVYFDVESDPLGDVDYLFGVLVRDTASGAVQYRNFWADDAAAERSAWQSFLDFLVGLEDFAIYHYAYYEHQVFDRLMLKYGCPTELVQKFREHAIDLHAKTIDSVVLPLYFYTLKDIAKYLGYHWRDPEAGGAESILWFQEYQKSHDPALKTRIVEYNEDDVRATMLLKDWLAGQKPSKGPRERLDEGQQ